MKRSDYVLMLQQAAQDIIWNADKIIPENATDVTVSIVITPREVPKVKITQNVLIPSIIKTYPELHDDM